ncbi:MAG: CopG family transcriptional regulator [Myxococcota bacterium]|nr:CopG family transcriptional regulator [Myxococcota bacterium]
MARSTTSIRLPEDLIEALDERAAALGVTRSQLIIQAVEQALADRSAWSPGFLTAIGTPRPELEETVDEMMEAIRELRSRSEAPEL